MRPRLREDIVSEHKYTIGELAVADTIEKAEEQRRVIQRIAGRNPTTIHIVLNETGEVVTKKMADKLRAEEQHG